MLERRNSKLKDEKVNIDFIQYPDMIEESLIYCLELDKNNEILIEAR